jgi:adenylate kinase family enzyme
MTQHRINIIGASGCGASTTGRAVAHELSVPHFDCDDYFHGPSDPPFQNPRSAEERYTLLMGDVAGASSWVLSGGVAGWDPYPQLDFTLMVFLWIPQDLRIERLRRRERERFGSRVALGGDMHEAHMEFIEWASRYDHGDVEGKTLQRHEAYLAEQSCPVMELRSEMTVAEAVARILTTL